MLEAANGHVAKEPPASLEQVLAASAATPEFKDAVRELRDDAGGERHIRFNVLSPPVKVLRVLTKLLHECAALPISAVDVEGYSGCSDYNGRVVVRMGEDSVRFEFAWDCKWKAEQVGWTDAFGLPDQIRAAQVFGWDCFRRWDEVA